MTEGIPPAGPVLPPASLNNRKPKTKPLPGETLNPVSPSTEETVEEIVADESQEEGRVNRLA